jgi:hypothetical protein
LSGADGLRRLAHRVLVGALPSLVVTASTSPQGVGESPGGLTLTAEFASRLEFIANEDVAETDLTRADDSRLRRRIRLRFSGEYSAEPFGLASPTFP